MIGVLNINKPKGITSSQVVVKIKKILGTGKVGHMGTLDPLASGVLPICVGKATRLFDYFLKKQKTYIARFSFGTQTDTLDLEGNIVKTTDNIPNINQIKNAIKLFLGDIYQIPPMYSSKKIDGKKAYDLARKGIEVSLEPCRVTIYEYSLVNQIDENTFEFKITCSAGTYIRALARDLGEKLNSCATMTSLQRIQSGNFKLETSINFDTITKEDLINNLMSLEQVLADFEKIAISKQDFQKLLNGQNVLIDNKKSDVNYYAVTVEDKIVGIGYIYNNNLKIKTYLLDN